MQITTIKYSTLFKSFIVFILLLFISLPFIYETISLEITFSIILLLGTALVLFIKSTPAVKYIAISLFWIKSIIILYLYNSTNIFIFPDSYNYIRILNDLVNMDTYNFQVVSNIAQTLHVGFYYIYLIIYQAFGNVLSILLMNTLLITLSSILFYEIIKIRFLHKIAFVTYILFSLSANIFLFGSFILKDPIVIFLTALSLYLYLVKKRTFLSLIVATFLVTVRIYSGFGVIAAIVINYLVFSNLTKKRKILAFSGILILFGIISNLPIAQSYLGMSTSFISNRFSFDFLIVIPVALMKFFFAPLPWNILEPWNIYRFLFFDSAIMLLLSIGVLLFIFKFIRFKQLRRLYYVFLIPILAHAFALGVEYGGDSTRQRSGVFVLLILTMVLGLFYKNKTYTEEERQ